MEKRLTAEVLKVNSELGVVFGYVIVSNINGQPYFDLQGDHIPEHSMLKAAYHYMSGDRPALVQHTGELTEPDGKVVFAFPLTSDIMKALGLSGEKTGLIVGVKFSDPEVLDRYKKGVYTGFSIGGHRVKDEAVND